MSAYIIVDFTTKDIEQLKLYGAGTPATLAQYGGEFLVKGSIQPLHGGSHYETKVIIEFTSRADAIGWYESPEYQQLIAIREQGMDCQFHLVGE